MSAAVGPSSWAGAADWFTRVGYAFANQYNLILLGGALGLSAALESSLPAWIAFELEVLWLLLASFSGAFSRHCVARSRRTQTERRIFQLMQAARGLDPAQVARIRAAAERCEEIRWLAVDRGLAGALLGAEGDRLQTLLGRLLEMARLHQRLTGFVAGATSAGREEEAVRLGQELAAEKEPGVRLSLRQALTAAQWRVSQLEWIDTTRRAVEARSRALEISLECARTWVFAGAAEEDIAAGLMEAAAATSVVDSLNAEAAAQLAPTAAAQRLRVPQF